MIRISIAPNIITWDVLSHMLPSFCPRPFAVSRLWTLVKRPKRRPRWVEFPHFQPALTFAALFQGHQFENSTLVESVYWKLRHCSRLWLMCRRKMQPRTLCEVCWVGLKLKNPSVLTGAHFPRTTFARFAGGGQIARIAATSLRGALPWKLLWGAGDMGTLVKSVGPVWIFPFSKVLCKNYWLWTVWFTRFEMYPVSTSDTHFKFSTLCFSELPAVLGWRAVFDHGLLWRLISGEVPDRSFMAV